jgi:hypothetical protein
MIRKANQSTDQISRSLLQKAIRRGNVKMTKLAIGSILQNNDFAWLRNRLGVITFEECWSYGSEVTFDKDEDVITQHLLNIAKTIKNKDAAGLGSLGYTLSQGDTSVLSGCSYDKNIKIISEAVKRPKDFWNWIRNQSDDKNRQVFIESAYEGFKKAGWLWDKAFTQAAAYLALTDGVPDVKYSEPDESNEFPFWISIDKHTKEGKSAIRQAAKQIGLAPQTALHIAFYLESAKCNAIEESFWWKREFDWRMKKLEISAEEASSFWNQLQPIVIKLLKTEVESNELRICNLSYLNSIKPIQESIFKQCPQSKESK